MLHTGFPQLQRVGATLRCAARASHCSGFSCCEARAPGARASAVVTRGPSCSAACWIFPDRSLNPCALHWQVDSQPLCHQGSPERKKLTYPLQSLAGTRTTSSPFSIKEAWGFPGGAVVESLPAGAGDTGSSPGLGGSHILRSD